MMRKIWAAILRLDDHWIGDAIGAASLFVILGMLMFAALGFGGVQ